MNEQLSLIKSNLKSYYEDELTTIYYGDAALLLKLLPNKSINLTLTDYPYGNNTKYNSYDDTIESLKALISRTIEEIIRVSERALITCGVANIHLFPKPDWILCWATPAGAGSSKWGFCCWQPILAYGKDPYLQNRMGRRPDLIIATETVPKWLKRYHPCPKPDDVWERIMMRGSVKDTDIILDPLMGIGTSLLVARRHNHKNIGFELIKSYCDVAIALINHELPEQTK